MGATKGDTRMQLEDIDNIFPKEYSSRIDKFVVYNFFSKNYICSGQDLYKCLVEALRICRTSNNSIPELLIIGYVQDEITKEFHELVKRSITLSLEARSLSDVIVVKQQPISDMDRYESVKELIIANDNYWDKATILSFIEDCYTKSQRLEKEKQELINRLDNQVGV